MPPLPEEPYPTHGFTCGEDEIAYYLHRHHATEIKRLHKKLPPPHKNPPTTSPRPPGLDEISSTSL